LLQYFFRGFDTRSSDDNHKPELALALTPFRALCGFQPLPDIAQNLSSTPELAALIPPAITEAFISISSTSSPTGPEAKAALKNVFAALMTAEEVEFKKQLDLLVQRYQKSSSTHSEGSIEELVLRLNSQFPGDIGVFCAFMLNHVALQPGEAIFLGAGEPHAYVSGGRLRTSFTKLFPITFITLDIIECMANSDNVIRAGLTPKLRDIPNLISGLTYVSAAPERHYVKPSPFPASSTSVESELYDPPIPEFSVVQVKLSGEKSDETHPPVDGPSLTVITEGNGVVRWDEDGEQSLDIKQGDVFFVGAGTEIKLSGDGLVLYRAFVEI